MRATKGRRTKGTDNLSHQWRKWRKKVQRLGSVYGPYMLYSLAQTLHHSLCASARDHFPFPLA